MNKFINLSQQTVPMKYCKFCGTPISFKDEVCISCEPKLNEILMKQFEKEIMKDEGNVKN